MSDNIKPLAVVTQTQELSESVNRVLSEITEEINAGGVECLMALTFKGGDYKLVASRTCDTTRKIGCLMRLATALANEDDGG